MIIDSLHIYQPWLLNQWNGGMQLVVEDSCGFSAMAQDTLKEETGGLMSMTSECVGQLEKISSQVSAIAEYGGGYDDAISVIVIPLINNSIICFRIPFPIQRHYSYQQ